MAVGAVLAFHCGAPGFSGGFVGVDVFFVISGYLICGILWRELSAEKFSIARFYQRRCKRILPALFAVLVFCLVAGTILLSPYEARQLGEDVVATALSLSNIDFYHRGSYFFQASLNPLLMTWSLAVEEQFYLVFPLLLWTLYKLARKKVFGAVAVICALSLLLSIALEFRHPEMNFYMPFTRAWELGAGCLLALWERDRTEPSQARPWLLNGTGVIGLLLIVASIALYSPVTRFPGYEAIPPVLGAVLMLASPGSLANRVLQWKPLVWIGLISYSLYLWHWPLLSFASIVSGDKLSGSVKALLMLLALVASIASFFWVEQPFRNRSRDKPKSVLWASVAVLGLFVAAGLAFYETRGLPQRVPQLAATERSLELDRAHTCLVGGDEPKKVLQCLPAVSDMPAVALLGDSHAEALQGELSDKAAEAGYKLLTMALYSCPPLSGATRFLANDPSQAANCSRFNKKAMAIVLGRPDVKVVVLTGSWAMVQEDVFAPDAYAGEPAKIPQANREAYLGQGLRAEIAALEDAGKRVILVDDVPSLRFAPIDIYRDLKLPLRGRLAHLLRGSSAEYPEQNMVPREKALTPSAERVRVDLQSLGREDERLLVIDGKSAFCDAANCKFSDGTNLYYVDNNHVSRFGAKLVLAPLNLKAISSK